MNCACNCFGIAASSKRPVKRYNLLVPDIFDGTPLPFGEELDASTLRKIKKLVEYVVLNPHRGPKVSRRLARRLHSENKPGKLGLVQLVAEAYLALLRGMPAEDSVLFAKELIVQRVDKDVGRSSLATADDALESVIGVLLQHSELSLRARGAVLLKEMISKQDDSDYITQLEALVPTLSRNAAPVSASLTLVSISTDQGAAAALRALQAHLALCLTLSRLPEHLQDLSDAILGTILIQHRSMPGGGGGLPPLLSAGTTGQPVCTASGSSLDTAYTAACELLNDLGHAMQGPANCKRVMVGILQHLDAGVYWGDRGAVEVVLSSVRRAAAEERQSYMLFSVLFMHLSSGAVSSETKKVLVQLGEEEGKALEGAMAAPALVLALRELPSHLPDSPQVEEDISLHAAILHCMRSLALNVDDSHYLVDTISAAAGKLSNPAALSTSTLRCLLAAAEAVVGLPAKLRAKGEHAFPELLLQHILEVLKGQDFHQRYLAHQILNTLLPVNQCSLRDSQTASLLSAIQQEVVADCGTPQLLEATSVTLQLVISGSSGTSMLSIARFLVLLRATTDDSRFQGLSSLNHCSVLALFNSGLAALQQRVSQGSTVAGSLETPVQTEDGLRTRYGLPGHSNGTSPMPSPRVDTSAQPSLGSMDAVRGVMEAVTGAATQLLNDFTGDGLPQSLSVDAAVRSIENGGSGVVAAGQLTAFCVDLSDGCPQYDVVGARIIASRSCAHDPVDRSLMRLRALHPLRLIEWCNELCRVFGDVSPEEATLRATALVASLKGVIDWRPQFVSALAEVPEISVAAGSVAAARAALLQPFEADGAPMLNSGICDEIGSKETAAASTNSAGSLHTSTNRVMAQLREMYVHGQRRGGSYIASREVDLGGISGPTGMNDALKKATQTTEIKAAGSVLAFKINGLPLSSAEGRESKEGYSSKGESRGNLTHELSSDHSHLNGTRDREGMKQGEEDGENGSVGFSAPTDAVEVQGIATLLANASPAAMHGLGLVLTPALLAGHS